MIWSRHSRPSFRGIDPARDHRPGRSRTFVSALSERRLKPLDDQAEVTRVGFEPNLTGVRDQRPHQKSNEPILSLSRLRKATSAGAGIDPDRPPAPRLTEARSLGFSRPLKTQAGNEHRPQMNTGPGSSGHRACERPSQYQPMSTKFRTTSTLGRLSIIHQNHAAPRVQTPSRTARQRDDDQFHRGDRWDRGDRHDAHSAEPC